MFLFISQTGVLLMRKLCANEPGILHIATAQGIHLRGKCIIETFLGAPFARDTPFDQFLFVHRDGMRSMELIHATDDGGMPEVA
ncbi:MAG: hypothetical protein ABJB16_05785 [Saprospiraceae bacterium]